VGPCDGGRSSISALRPAAVPATHSTPGHSARVLPSTDRGPIRTRARERGLEDLGEFGARDLATLDVDELEHRVVEAPPRLGVGVEVGGVAVAGEPYCESQHLVPPLEVGFCVLEFGFRCRLLLGDAVLVRLEQLERDRVGVIGAQELLALVRERGELLGERDAGFGASPRRDTISSSSSFISCVTHLSSSCTCR
jgi:hypothetical protein